VFDKTMILDDAKWAAFVTNPDATVLQADPAFAYASAFIKNYNNESPPAAKRDGCPVSENIRRYFRDATRQSSPGLRKRSSGCGLPEIQATAGFAITSGCNGNNRSIRNHASGYVPDALSFHSLLERAHPALAATTRPPRSIDAVN